MHYMYPEERVFRRKILTWLEENDYNTLKNELLDLALVFSEAIKDENGNMQGAPAYISTEPDGERIIHIDKYYENKDIKIAVALVIHELMHKIMNHHPRALRKAANELGLDPDNLDNINLEKILRAVYSPSAMSRYGNAHISNVAGDYNQSEIYSKEMEDVFNDLDFYGQKSKGLMLKNDHPELIGKSYEDLINHFTKENDKIRKARYNIVHGTTDPKTGEWIENQNYKSNEKTDRSTIVEILLVKLKKFTTGNFTGKFTDKGFITNGWGKWEKDSSGFKALSEDSVKTLDKIINYIEKEYPDHSIDYDIIDYNNEQIEFTVK